MILCHTGSSTGGQAVITQATQATPPRDSKDPTSHEAVTVLIAATPVTVATSWPAPAVAWTVDCAV